VPLKMLNVWPKTEGATHSRTSSLLAPIMALMGRERVSVSAFYQEAVNAAPHRRVFYLAGLIKLFSQMTREVVRSPGPGTRAQSTAIFAFNLSSTCS
jgi:hypothetical protein